MTAQPMSPFRSKPLMEYNGSARGGFHERFVASGGVFAEDENGGHRELYTLVRQGEEPDHPFYDLSPSRMVVERRPSLHSKSFEYHIEQIPPVRELGRAGILLAHAAFTERPNTDDTKAPTDWVFAKVPSKGREFEAIWNDIAFYNSELGMQLVPELNGDKEVFLRATVEEVARFAAGALRFSNVNARPLS